MRCRSAERVAHSRVKSQPRIDETLLWKVPADPADPPDPPDQVSSAAGRNHWNTRAGGEDYVSSNQTHSNQTAFTCLPATVALTSSLRLRFLGSPGTAKPPPFGNSWHHQDQMQILHLLEVTVFQQLCFTGMATGRLAEQRTAALPQRA